MGRLKTGREQGKGVDRPGTLLARRVVLLVATAGSLVFLSASPAGSPQREAPVRRVREIGLGPLSPVGRTGLAFIRHSERFLALDRGPKSLDAREWDVAAITERGERSEPRRMAFAGRDPLNAAYDDLSGRLLVLDPLSRRMSAIRASSDGALEPGSVLDLDVSALGLSDPQGVTTDGEGGVYILDMSPPRIVRAELLAGGVLPRSVSPLAPDLGADLQGLAFEPKSGHLFVLAPRAFRLYELTTEGEIVSTRNLSRTLRGRLEGLTFAPSGDRTDDPEQTSLYIVEKMDGPVAGSVIGQITELSLQPLAAAIQAVPVVVATVVQNVHTHLFSPPSPDPDGVTYYPPHNSLLVTDSEVEEMSIFQGANVFEISLGGILLRTGATTSFSDEPTGIVYDPSNGHLFVSDDDAVRINNINPGADGIPFTADDVRTYFSLTPTGSTDPEDVALDTWRRVLYWVDGISSEVYKALPGPNGVFDGVAPAGDDVVTHFDTTVLGVTDPECIAFNTDNGHLFIMGISPSVIAETDPDGNPLRTINASATNANKPASLGYGPSSVMPGQKSLYLVTRGVDNNEVSSENDGELYELSFPPLTAGNLPPTADAGPDQTVRLPSSAALVGAVSDDGIPDPPGTVTATWKQADGPGTATFADAGALHTTASFSAPGTYTLSLTASDGELSASDTIVVTVLSADGSIPLEVRVVASADDAEEAAAGTVDLVNGDLELVEDASVQTVGLRFRGVGVPAGATITNAYIQFKADETSSVATNLVLQGQAADSAAAFTTTAYNVSSRPRTVAAVAWAPPPWTAIGDAGAAQRTPNISSVIQEIVGRPGWTSGSALAIIVTGSGKRVAESYNGDQAGAALLHVDYSMTPPTVHDVAVIGVTAPTPVTIGQAQTVTVNVANQGNAAETFQVSLGDSLGATVGAPQTLTNLGAGASRALSFAWTPTVIGTHVVTASAAIVTGETDTADNAGSTASVVEPVPVYDVAVTGVTAPTPVTVGEAHTVTVSVVNQGTAAETFQVSLGDSLGATVGAPQTVTGLAAGGSADLSFAWTPSVTGSHALTATAATVTGETDTADNVRSTTSVVNALAVHDVAVSGVAAPTPVTVNQAQTVTVNVANQGTGSETFQVSLGDSLGATVGAPQTVTGLAAGGSRLLSFAWTPTATGTHTLTATAATVSGETDTADNVRSTTSVAEPAPVYDVAVTGMTAPTPVTVNQAQTVTVNVANQGTSAETFQVSLGDSLGATVGAPQTVTNLAAGATRSLGFAWTPTVTGSHMLTATAATVSGETDTADNVGSTTSVVEAAPVYDVAVTGVTAPTPVTVGLAQTVTVNVANQSTVAETFLVSLSDSLGATVGTPQTVTSLAPGGSRALSFAWTPTVTGSHTLTATAATVSGETDTADNAGSTTSVVEPAPVFDVAVTGVTAPTPVTIGVAQTVTVHVANQGTVAETFQVSLSDSLGATVGAPQTVTNLAAGAAQTLSFAWTPTVAGTHTLTATAATVSGETDTADNAGSATAVANAPAVHDVAVTGVTAPTPVIIGQLQTVTVDLANQGSFSETFQVSLSDSLGATVGAPQTVTNLAAGATQSLSFAWTPTVAGAHTLTATAATVSGETDTADNLRTAASNVVDGSASLEARVAASADDAEEAATGKVDRGSSDLELVEDLTVQTVGMRFTRLGIPNKATITNAYIQFKAKETSSVATTLNIQAQAVDSASTFATSAFNISSRPRTAAVVPWTPAPWTTVGEVGAAERTPNLAAVIQEIVNRPGWASGGSMAIIVTGSGKRVATAYNGEAAGAPLLHVEYASAGAAMHDVAVTGVAAPTPVTMGEAQTVAVTVANQGTAAETFQVSLSDSLGATIGLPQTVTGLAAGAGRTLSFAWTPTMVGTHTLTATAAAVTGETDTADNAGTAASVVNALAVHDVAVTGVSAPTPVTLGQAQTVTVSVANQGSAAETFQVALSDNLGATVGPPQTVTNLAAGAGQALTFAWTPSVAGTHTLTGTAATVSGETDTADNAATASSVVSGVTTHDVAVTAVTAPTPVVAGQAQTVSVTLTNQGSYSETFQVGLSDSLGATVGGPQTVTNLAGFTSTTLSFAWTPTITGTHTLTATAAAVSGETDTADNVLTKAAEVTNSLITLDVRVAASSDDAEEALAGTVDRGSSDLELVEDASVQTVGMRFNGLTIPKGATITSAYIQFKVDETSSAATTLLVQGQAADNAATFQVSALNISSRPRTVAAVPWAPAAWTAVGTVGPAQRTPDLAPVIQEIVGRAGWTSGNSLVLIITGTGKRVAVAYNGEAAGAPVLHVEYTLGQ